MNHERKASVRLFTLLGTLIASFAFLFSFTSSSTPVAVAAEESVNQERTASITFSDPNWLASGRSDALLVDSNGHMKDSMWLTYYKGAALTPFQVNLNKWNSNSDKQNVITQLSNAIQQEHSDLVTSYLPTVTSLDVDNKVNTNPSVFQYYEYDGFVTGSKDANNVWTTYGIASDATADGRPGNIGGGVGHFPHGGVHLGSAGHNGGLTLNFAVPVASVTVTFGPYVPNDSTIKANYLPVYNASNKVTGGWGEGCQCAYKLDGETSFIKVAPNDPVYLASAPATACYVAPVKANVATAVSDHTDYGDTTTATFSFPDNTMSCEIASGSLFSHGNSNTAGNRIVIYNVDVQVNNVKAFAYKLKSYKTCTEYQDAYNFLNPYYAYFSAYPSEIARLDAISVSDYDYTNASAYNASTKTYVSGGTKTIMVSAYQKWLKIVSLATGVSPTGQIVTPASNPTTPTLIIVAASGSFTLFSLAFILAFSRYKKRKAQRD